MKDKTQQETVEFKDDFIKDFVQNGQHTISNKNFDREVMRSVYTVLNEEKEVNANLKRSMYFFYFAIVLIVTYMLISIFGTSMVNTSANLVPILVLFFTLVFGIVLKSNFKRFFQSVSF